MKKTISRTALFGYRLRFSPETQPIRQSIVESILLRNVANYGDEAGATIGKIMKFEAVEGPDVTLPLEESRKALRSLQEQGLLITRTIRRKTHWNISESGNKKIQEDEQTASTMTRRTLEALFPGEEMGEEYKACFLEVVASVFDRLTESYLKAMFAKEDSPITPGALKPIIRRAITRYSSVDEDMMTKAVDRFFAESTPDFDWLKWTYCKNYYAVRAIGLGPDADLLSREVFADTTFYLDTNVLIPALDKTSPNHAAVTQTILALREIGCPVKVLSISITEFRDLLQARSENLQSVLRQIPDALLPRVRGMIPRAEARHRADPAEPTPQQLLEHYQRIEALVVSELELEVHYDNEWFDSKWEDPQVMQLAERLKEAYDASSSQSRRKTPAAAVHDALALKYLRSLQGEHLLLTLDASLPVFVHTALSSAGQGIGPALSVHAVMPWLCSVTSNEEVAEHAVSGLLSTQLLPFGTQFSLAEFRMLATLDMECGKMPAQDVEDCLMYLRRHARRIDISSADGREELNGIVRRFFASPDRAYLARVSELENALDTKEQELSREREEHQREQRKNAERSVSLTGRVLRGEVLLRLVLVGFVLVVGECLAMLVAAKYASGENLIQRIGNLWWLFGTIVVAALGLARWLCRGERWEAAKPLFGFLGRS